MFMDLYLFSIKKYKIIAGLDEAGRGSWAGPVVAGCVVLTADDLKDKSDILEQLLRQVKDSKVLSPTKREELFDVIVENFNWGVGLVSAGKIDQIGIGRAVKQAMRLAVKKIQITPQLLLVDYYRDIGLPIKTKGIVKGDAKVFCIAAASIVAKVYRDRLMNSYDKRWGRWQFAQHKGYGTAKHRQLIDRFGLSPIHRCSFAPMKFYIKD